MAETHHVARWVAKRAVADAVALIHRLLQHLRAGSAHVLEGCVAVVGGEDDGAQHAVGQELRHHLLVVRSGVRIGRRGSSTMLKSGRAFGPTVTQRMPSYLTL